MTGEMPIRSGVHKGLEEAANAMLKHSLRNVTKHSEKSDLLTPWKEQERRRREVYVPSGVPDPTLRRGQFHREINRSAAHLNSSEGKVASRRKTTFTDWDNE